jgi:hypothetical protein
VSAAAERAAVALIWWSDRAREAREALRTIADGLDDAEKAEAASLLQDRQFARQSSAQLAERMLDLAGKSGVRR